jgi:hypothetical protein
VRIVQTLVVRDEEDIVGAQIGYHLNAGVDFVIATDHASRDGTTDLLESFARDGVLRRIAVQGEMHDGRWRTQMARLAAVEHGADWVINTDADEFWVPRGASLERIFASVPEGYGIVFALSRHFPPRPDGDGLFSERMTVRVSTPLGLHDPTSPYRPHLKAAHRADPDISISHGAHSAASRRWRPVHHWHPADVLHFPFRSRHQWENKGVRRARGDSQLGQYVAALLASEAGRSEERYRSLVVDDATLEQGAVAGTLIEDFRLRDALRSLRGEDGGDGSAQSADGGDVITDSAAVRDADVVRLRRHVDDLAARVSRLEPRARLVDAR